MKLNTWTSAARGRSLALANALGVSPPTVSDWCTGKKAVPVERCVAIERATNGEVNRQDLRPDDWQNIWPELAAATAIIAPDAIETVSTDNDAIRTGAVRRRAMRMAKGIPVDGDRRSQEIPPFQVPVVGVA